MIKMNIFSLKNAMIALALSFGMVVFNSCKDEELAEVKVEDSEDVEETNQTEIEERYEYLRGLTADSLDAFVGDAATMDQQEKTHTINLINAEIDAANKALDQIQKDLDAEQDRLIELNKENQELSQDDSTFLRDLAVKDLDLAKSIDSLERTKASIGKEIAEFQRDSIAVTHEIALSIVEIAEDIRDQEATTELNAENDEYDLESAVLDNDQKLALEALADGLALYQQINTDAGEEVKSDYELLKTLRDEMTNNAEDSVTDVETQQQNAADHQLALIKIADKLTRDLEQQVIDHKSALYDIEKELEELEDAQANDDIARLNFNVFVEDADGNVSAASNLVVNVNGEAAGTTAGFEAPFGTHLIEVSADDALTAVFTITVSAPATTTSVPTADIQVNLPSTAETFTVSGIVEANILDNEAYNGNPAYLEEDDDADGNSDGNYNFIAAADADVLTEIQNFLDQLAVNQNGGREKIEGAVVMVKVENTSATAYISETDDEDNVLSISNQSITGFSSVSATSAADGSYSITAAKYDDANFDYSLVIEAYKVDFTTVYHGQKATNSGSDITRVTKSEVRNNNITIELDRTIDNSNAIEDITL